MSKKPKAIHLCESCDSPLPKKRKYCDERCEKIQLCKSMGTTKYKTKHVAPLFQRMIRAEAGAKPATYVHLAVVEGRLEEVTRKVGQCVCVTCGRLCPWEGGTFNSQLHCGHFLAGRGSILFEEECVAPQCAGCNRHHHGRPLEFRIWMEAVRGIEVIERLDAMKHSPLSRSRDELVDMWIEFNRRLKAAQTTMKGIR